MPSAWWCTYDSGTLKNGATLLPVLATFTNVEGKIQTAFLDARSHGKRYDAQATSELVHRTVTDHLNPDALIGVLLDGVVPERTQRRFRTRPRWLLLTTIPTDGKELASGRLLAQRVNPGAVLVWEWLHRGNAVGARTLKIRTATGRAENSSSSDSESGSSSSSSSDESSPATAFRHDAIRLAQKLCYLAYKLFKMGQGRVHYSEALAEYGFQPRAIKRPCATRLVVYSVEFMDQSLRHYGPRVRGAMLSLDEVKRKLAESEAAGKTRTDLKKAVRKHKSLIEQMQDVRQYYAAAVVADLLRMRHGFTDALVIGQSSQLPSMPRYAGLRAGVLLMAWQSGTAVAVGENDGILQHALPAFKLQEFGFVPTWQARHGSQRDPMLCDNTYRCGSCGLLIIGLETARSHCWDAHFAHRSFRQRHDEPFVVKVRHRNRPGRRASAAQVHQAQRKHWAWHTAMCVFRCRLSLLRLLSSLVPSGIRWSAVVPLFFGRGLRWALPRACIATVGVLACSSIHKVPVTGGVAAALAGVDAAAKYVRDLSSALRQAFVPSFFVEPDDVPVDLAEAMLICWWAPALLQSQSRIGHHQLHAWRICFAYVQKRVGSALLPLDEATADQEYIGLVNLWREQGNSPEARARLFTSSKGATTVAFDWIAFWEMTHTAPGWVEAKVWHAFFVFHFLGMLGHSEASAESSIGTLKRCSNSEIGVSTLRAVQKARLVLHGIRGVGYDDFFILRVWGEFFGQSSFPFWVANRTSRERKWPLGAGSITLHRARLNMRLGRPKRLPCLSRMAVRRVARAGASRIISGVRRTLIKGRAWRDSLREGRRAYD